MKSYPANCEEVSASTVRSPDFLDVSRAGLSTRTARASALNLASLVVRYPLTIVTTVVLARLLTPADFGVYEVVGALALLWATFADLGLSAATVHREKLHEDEVSGLFWMNLITGMAVCAILVLSGPLLARLYGDRRQTGLAALVGLSFVFTNVRVQHVALCVRRHEFGKLVLADFVGQGTGIFAAVAVALWGGGPWALAAQPLAVGLGPSIFLWIMFPWRPRLTCRWSVLRPLLSFGGYLTLGRWIGNVFLRVDKMLLALFVSAAVLGQYGRAFFLSTLPWVILCAPLIQPLTSMLARVINDDHDRARAIYLQFWQFTIAVPMFAALLLAAYGGDAVSLLYGHQWAGAGQYLRLLSVGAAFFVTYSAAFSLAVVHGKVKELFGWALWMSPVYVVCFLVGVRYGAWGMAVGYSTAMTVAGISAVLLSARWLGMAARQLGKSSFAPACIAVGTAAVSIALREAASAFTANWVLASGGSLALVGVGYSFLLYRFCPGVVGNVTRAARMAVSSAQGF